MRGTSSNSNGEHVERGSPNQQTVYTSMYIWCMSIHRRVLTHNNDVDARAAPEHITSLIARIGSNFDLSSLSTCSRARTDRQRKHHPLSLDFLLPPTVLYCDLNGCHQQINPRPIECCACKAKFLANRYSC